MKRIVMACVLVSLLAGCATVRKVETGVNTVGERLSFNLDGPWNHVDFPGIKPGQVWTMEGIFVDELVIYSGIKNGEKMHAPNPAGGKTKDIVFTNQMNREELAAMFEGVLAKDGSAVNRKRISPSAFGGSPGVMFEFERTRKDDGLKQLGFGYAAIDGGELFALVYVAPEITFFQQHKDRVERVAKTAQIRSEGTVSDSQKLVFVPVNISSTRVAKGSQKPNNVPTQSIKAGAGPAGPASSGANATIKPDAQSQSGKVARKSVEQRLEELKKLYEKGLISKENFISQQKRMLDFLD